VKTSYSSINTIVFASLSEHPNQKKTCMCFLVAWV